MFENPEVALDGLPAADSVQWQGLDSRYVRRLQVQALIVTAVIAAGVLVVQMLPLPIDRRLFVLAWAIVLVIGIADLLWPLVSVPRKGYAIRDKDILYLVRHEAPRRICTHVLLHPGATPGEVRDVIGVSAPTLSFHLAALERAGLVASSRQGRSIVYAPDFGAVAELVGFLYENCCGDGACAPVVQLGRPPAPGSKSTKKRST